MNTLGKQLREDILVATMTSRNGHLPTDFSIVEQLIAVYEVMKHDPRHPEMADRDIFILSKGHAALAHYCVLARLGYFPVEDPRTFGMHGTRYGCHEDRFKVRGVEMSTGSLGHGLGVAVGMALAFKIKKNSRKTFILIGDGESNEGSVWEAAAVASDQKLDNVTIIYDNNQSQLRGLQISNPAERFRAFGWDACDVNGHDVDEIRAALQAPQTKPKAVIAHAQKGYGCKTLVEEMYAWHRRTPNDEEYKMLMEELHAEAVS